MGTRILLKIFKIYFLMQIFKIPTSHTNHFVAIDWALSIVLLYKLIRLENIENDQKTIFPIIYNSNNDIRYRTTKEVKLYYYAIVLKDFIQSMETPLWNEVIIKKSNLRFSSELFFYRKNVVNFFTLWYFLFEITFTDFNNLLSITEFKMILRQNN